MMKRAVILAATWTLVFASISSATAPIMPIPGDPSKANTWGTLLADWLSRAYGHNVLATTYGADPTGATDSSAAIQKAIDAAEADGSGIVFFLPGTYKCQIHLDAVGRASSAAYPVLAGSGTNGTILKPVHANEAVIHITGKGHWRYPYTIRDLRIDGTVMDARDANGIMIDSEKGGLRPDL
jgi:hypothetical protein